jgi:hypothetical protein
VRPASLCPPCKPLTQRTCGLYPDGQRLSHQSDVRRPDPERPMSEETYAVHSPTFSDATRLSRLKKWLEVDPSLPREVRVSLERPVDERTGYRAASIAMWLGVVLPSALLFPSFIDSLRGWLRTQPSEKQPWPITIKHGDTTIQVHSSDELEDIARISAPLAAQLHSETGPEVEERLREDRTGRSTLSVLPMGRCHRG